MHKQLKVFLASPSDIKKERQTLKTVIDEINTLYLGRLGLGIQLLRWETNTYPDVGDDAQSVINDQIGDQYDVFIGILWTRIGTQTKRHLSGTLEEFRRAYNRSKANPNSVHLMMYFRSSALSPDQIDATQLSEVQNFKKKLGDLGVYWWAYKSSLDFERHVRLHLSALLLDTGVRWGGTIPTTPIGASIDSTEEDLLQKQIDLLSSYSDFMNLATGSSRRIRKAFETFTKRLRERTNKISQLPKDAAGQRKLVANLNNFSHTMDQLVEDVKVIMPALSKYFREAIDCLITFASSTEVIAYWDIIKNFMTDMESKGNGMLTALDFVNSSTAGALENVMTMINEVRQFPNEPPRFAESKVHLLGMLDELQSEFETQRSLVLSTIGTYKRILK